MSEIDANFAHADRVARYLEQGPPAFAPGHADMLQLVGVLLAERVPAEGGVLVVGAGGGLESPYLAKTKPSWRFVGVDPAPAELDPARATAGPSAGDRLHLIERTKVGAPPGP